jgi:exopolysaccharide biosynthesis WecB/TagA/CpsF family protein
MEIRLETQPTDAVVPEEMVLPVTGNVKRKFFLRGRKREKELLSGSSLSLAVVNKLSLTASFEQALQQVGNMFKVANKPSVVSFINAHGFNLCHSNKDFSSAILGSDIVFRDGKGVEILCKSAGVDPGINMCGTDTIPMILGMLKESSIALLGTEDRYLVKAAAVLRERGNKVVLTKNGFDAIDSYVATIEEIQPKVILLGMGMPKQELVSALLREKLDYPCLIINGGAIIDHFGGKVSRAPKWMRKHGLEWVYRLLREPVRLFNRYVVGNIVFLMHTRRATGRIRL